MRTRVQLISAVGAGLIGIGGMALGLFLPRFMSFDCVRSADAEVLCTSSAESLYAQTDAFGLMMFLVPSCCYLIAAIAGVRNARTPARTTRHLLWSTAAALGILTIAMVASLGAFMLPGTLLAIYAAILARSTDADAPTIDAAPVRSS
jgi:hypothetical protein